MAVKLAVKFEQPRDYRDEIKAPSDHVRLLEVPTRRYLMVDGDAEPGSQGFRDAISSLYPVAYTLHFALKRRGIDAPVGALEGMFWIGEPGPTAITDLTTFEQRKDWQWRLLLPVPDAASAADITAAMEEVRGKKAPMIDKLRCRSWAEGRAAQILHVGPYSAEPATVGRLHRAIDEAGLHMRGCHHEIYIGDPNRTRPERLKTIIRQPVA